MCSFFRGGCSSVRVSEKTANILGRWKVWTIFFTLSSLLSLNLMCIPFFFSSLGFPLIEWSMFNIYRCRVVLGKQGKGFEVWASCIWKRRNPMYLLVMPNNVEIYGCPKNGGWKWRVVIWWHWKFVRTWYKMESKSKKTNKKITWQNFSLVPYSSSFFKHFF